MFIDSGAFFPRASRVKESVLSFTRDGRPLTGCCYKYFAPNGAQNELSTIHRAPNHRQRIRRKQNLQRFRTWIDHGVLWRLRLLGIWS